MIPRSQNLIPLNSGAYQARSTISNFQICENAFPEISPEDTDPAVAVTHYPREGKRPLSSPPTQGRGRGIFTLSNGHLFACVGNSLYYIDKNWVHNLLGTIQNISTPVSMSDNGVTGVLVDGTTAGYTIDLATNAFASLFDSTGTFVGSRRVDFADTYLAFAAPGTNEWYLTLSDQVVFNALVQANKDSTPDPIQTFAFNLRQAWLLGTRHAEIWFLAGSTPFPYEEWPNVFVPYGCAAPYSLTQADVDLFWISSNEQGKILALKTNGYGVLAISTRALEYEWSTYSTVADVIGGSFQQAGHTFVVFHFPTADKTWAYDLSTRQWHRRTYIDQNGVIHREKTAFYAAVGASGGYPEAILGQDWATGELYALDPNYYTDNGMPIVCRRSFPHIVNDLKFVTHAAFVADFDTGETPDTAENEGGSPWSSAFSSAFGPQTQTWNAAQSPTLFMRYSNDGGASWGNYRPKTNMSSGHYRSMMRWRGLGMARDRVYELMWSFPGKTALNGAYLEPLLHSA